MPRFRCEQNHLENNYSFWILPNSLGQTPSVPMQDVPQNLLPEPYINPNTGEIVTVTDEDRHWVEDDENWEGLPAWQRETLPRSWRDANSPQLSANG